MSRRIKEFIDIRDHASLDDLIGKLIEVRDSLPTGAGPELRLRGDDIFGRKLSISYFRDMTAEEADCEARYTSAQRDEQEDGEQRDWRAVA
jgi:hypothetical protein